MSVLLQADDLGLRIDGAWIWRGVSLAFAPGERLALAGPTGSGKTLLLRVLAGLREADAGSVRLAGRELDDWSLPRFRSQVVYLAQKAGFAEGAVEENLRLPFTFAVRRQRAQYSRDRAVELLEALGRRAEFLDKSIDVLSGGERQIAALVRALLVEPRILLLDEPTASMDEETARRAERLVDGWLERAGDRACLWTSHDASQLDRVASRRLDLGGGSS